MPRTTKALQTPRLSDCIGRAIAGASCFINVTNFFGGQPKEAFEEGHSQLKYYELGEMTRRVKQAVDGGEELTATFVLQDFQASPDLIIARQILRQDDKYMKQELPEKLDFAAHEISTSMRALYFLSEYTCNNPTVKVEVWAARGMISAPVIWSDTAAAIGEYLPNLSDFDGPVRWFEADDPGYDAIEDGCRTHLDNSIQIIGDHPHWRADSFLKLALDEARLATHFKNQILNDPFKFPEYYVDQRLFLEPNI